MAELMLLTNPRRRRKKVSRKRRQPAALRKYWAAKRGGGHKKRRVARRRRRHVAVAAPRRHRRRRGSGGGAIRAARGYTVGNARIRRRKLNPHRRRYHRRHNPSLRGIIGQVKPTAVSGAYGAAGALALDGLWGLLNSQLPSVAGYLTNPYVALLAKALGAVAVGAVGGKVLHGKGREMAVGAMTVQLHDFFKVTLLQMAPGVFGPGGSFPLGAYLSGAAPIVGVATIPQSYLPFGGVEPGGPVGAYLSGSTGYNDGSSGMFYDDSTGY